MLSVEGLTQVNADGRVVPRVAERWEWEKGGQSLRVFLRPNVYFHDGTRVTAPVASEVLGRVISRPGNKALYPSINDVTGITADGDLQLLIDLSQPSAFLPEDLSVPLQLAPDVGTGPYRVAKRDGANVTLDRFDKYYLGVPSISQVMLRPFDGLRNTWSSLLRGEVDMMTEVPPDSVEFVKTADIQTFSFPHWYQFVLAFNSATPTFASPAVRRALNVAVDRESLIKNALRGSGAAATGPLWPRHWAYDTAVQGYGFDPASAGVLLDAAGFRRGTAKDTRAFPGARFRFTCLIPAKFSLLERLALELQRQFYDVGVDVQFESLPPVEYDARIREGKFEAVLVDMISGPTLGRPYIFWRSARTFKSGLNVFGYENGDAERLFQLLRTSMSEAAVRSATSRLQRVLLDDPPAVFLAWNQRVRVVRQEFKVYQEAGRDPVPSLWRWTPNADSSIQTASVQ
jgi:peptide/nickel transport system substrate-binding protein